MEPSDSIARLCEVCSELNIQCFTHPCRNPSPCSSPPIEGAHATFFPFGSIDEIKDRRFACDICKLIAESLDKQPSDLKGECSVRETEELCNFRLPRGVKAGDPSITHFHLTQLSVIYFPPKENRFHGPSLPWEFKARQRDDQSSYYIQIFQVKARSSTEAGDLTPTSAQAEREFLDTIGGRYVSTQVNIQLLCAWLRQCESEHGEVCMPSLRLPDLPAERNGETVFRPTFVVDVIQSCLVDTPSQCRYVALSYVWGTAPVFKHLLENTRDLRRAGSLHPLPIPATIRDAITLVHAIGERYLWVDSLCIIQNDLKMQQAEMMRMGSIYSGALFTIIAAAGDHADSGLPGIEQGSREQVQKVLKFADCELLTLIDIRHTPNGIDDTIVWAERAWTFQEQVLSNRVLVFSESQAYWSCRAASYSEEQALEQVRDIRRRQISFPQKHAADSLTWAPLEPLEYRDIYRRLISSYRQRRLSYETDMLNAFNGVSEILGALQGDTFHWGLPGSLFSYAMTWFFIGPSSRNYVEVPVFDSNGCKEMIPIPSWSWAAWSGSDPSRPPSLVAGDANGPPVIHFDIVDEKRKLVRIKDWPVESHAGDFVSALWNHEVPHQVQSPTQHSVLRIGQLQFWTSLANMRAIRHWSKEGTGSVFYTVFPSPYFEPHIYSTYEIVHQDFIVVAARDPGQLLLLAIEWKEGVAYRVGLTEVMEADWLRVENREWRLITLG